MSIHDPPVRKQAPSKGAAATEMRDLALGALSRRHGVLLDRSKRRMLTPKERAEIEGLEAAIGALQDMGAVTKA